jgi:hypothetical protein
MADNNLILSLNSVNEHIRCINYIKNTIKELNEHVKSIKNGIDDLISDYPDFKNSLHLFGIKEDISKIILLISKSELSSKLLEKHTERLIEYSSKN